MKLLKVSVSALAMLVLAGVSGLQAQTIKLGAVVSLTGPGSTLGDPEHKTLTMYVDQVNKAGGLLGRQIEMIVYDDATEPAKANAFAKRLIEDDKVDFIIGGTTTGATMAMYQVIEKAEMPFMALGGASVIISPVKKWMFKVSHNDDMSTEKVLADMKKKGIKSFALISDTGGYGQSGRKSTTELAKKYDLEMVADETFGTKDTDMTPQLAKIKANPKAQAIFVFGFGQGVVTVTKNIAQLGFTIPHYEAAGSASQEYLDLSGAAAEGVRLPSPAILVADQLPANDPLKAVTMEYAKSYSERYKTAPSTFGGYARDAFFIWVDAVKRAGSLDRVKLRDAIESTKNYVGSNGVVNMTPEDHLGLGLDAFKLITAKGGKWQLAE